MAVTYKPANQLNSYDEIIFSDGSSKKVAGKRIRDGKVMVTFVGGKEAAYHPNATMKIKTGFMTKGNLPSYMEHLR